MSDETSITPSDAITSEAVPDAPASAPAPTAGELLREARLATGMHIATLSLALKVPVKKLEALEANDWTQLPDAVFVRALATSICRQVKTDSAPILAALPKTPTPRVIDDEESRGLNYSFRVPTDQKSAWLHWQVSTPVLLSVIGLLLAALVLMFLPDMIKNQEAKKPEVVESVVVPSASPTLPNVALATAPTTSAVAASAPITAQTTTVSLPAASSLPPSPLTSASSASASSLSGASAPTPVPLPNGVPILRMVAKGVVWVEVKDSKGSVMVMRTLQPKEVVNVSGVPPLAVVVGRINEIQSVDVRGKPFNLTGLSPDNVARFEVK